MSVKVDIISGFLGAGKTTFLKKIIEEKVFGDEKLAIIENEFGKVGIDGILLADTGIQIREINSGCICCTLAGDFEKAISELIEKFNPHRIIIEPSGVGKLSDVIKACRSPKIDKLLVINTLITVVDAQRYKLYISNFSEFYENQIKHAATILLSRTKDIEQEKVLNLVKDINKINPAASIVTTPWDLITARQIIDVAEKLPESLLENQVKVGKLKLKRPKTLELQGTSSHNCTDNHIANEVFEVWGIETPKIFDEQELRDILLKLYDVESFGMVLRGKGILQISQDKWVQFDYVPGEIVIQPTKPDYTGRLCFIGNEIKKDVIMKTFHAGG